MAARFLSDKARHVANWTDLERRATFLRKEIGLVRDAMADIAQSQDKGAMDHFDQLKKIEALRGAELLAVEKQLASRRL